MNFLRRLIGHFGIVPRPPSRTVIIWIDDAKWLPVITQAAGALQRKFPRTYFVFAQQFGSDHRHGFPSVSIPGSIGIYFLLRRLRCHTLIIAGEASEKTSLIVKRAYARGIALVQLERKSADSKNSFQTKAGLDLVDIVISAEELATHPEVADSLKPLLTRSRRKTLADRRAEPLSVRILRLMRSSPLKPVLNWKFRQYESVPALKQALNNPHTVLCLGNGPSSEHIKLQTLTYDSLFRVNLIWNGCGFLSKPDLVFTGLAQAPLKVYPQAGFVFGNILSEEKILSGLLFRPLRIQFSTAERLGIFNYSRNDNLHPTNGALMIAMAVALQPARLVVAGIDLFDHPDGAYPGNSGIENAYAIGHDAAFELKFLIDAFQQFRGDLIILSEPLQRALTAEKIDFQPSLQDSSLC